MGFACSPIFCFGIGAEGALGSRGDCILFGMLHEVLFVSDSVRQRFLFLINRSLGPLRGGSPFPLCKLRTGPEEIGYWTNTF